jgi:hypothetical protein
VACRTTNPLQHRTTGKDRNPDEHHHHHGRRPERKPRQQHQRSGGRHGLAALIAFGWLFHATHGGDKASPNSGRGAFLKSGKFKISIAFVLGGLVMTGGGFIANIFTHISSTIS